MDRKERDFKDFDIEIEDASVESEYENIEGQKEHILEKRGSSKRIASYIAIALISAIIGGLISPYIAMNYLYADRFPTEVESNNQLVYKIEGNNPNVISLAAEKSMSSVVGITTKRVQNIGFISQEVNGLGSGVIVDQNGYILTNSHVIGDGNAKDIMVLLENGDKAPGKVLWHDSSIDLAIVKIDEKNLPVASFGDSDALKIGETAIAIGNPLGLEFQKTVTSGIISGLHRSIQVDRYNVIEDLIQTDASINEGNSGGPLLNCNGEVIGINTAKIKTAEGLGFAIPINMVKTIIEKVIAEGDYKTVLFGITGMEVKVYERQLGIELKVDDGVVIIEIVPDSPAHRAGLSIGDIIIGIDDREIKSMNQLKKVLYGYKEGDRANVDIIRNNVEEQIEIEFSVVK